jgi:hypothetical protein
VQNLVASAIEEILSFRPGSCHGCRELHEELKAALMAYLLATTNMYVQGKEVAEARITTVEFDLANALKEFHSHRKDTHFMEYFALSWMEMPVRNAS